MQQNKTKDNRYGEADGKGFMKERIRLPESQRSRQNFPIASHVKSKYIYAAEPIDETSWAYMKLLREHSDMKSFSNADPYAEVYRFRDNLYAIFTESADGMGDPWMYLIVGPEKAMLVDTGFGIGNIRALCDEITGGKELIAVNTHGHYDHAYGNCWFDCVYCHEYEEAKLLTQDGHIWDYLFQDDGTPIWLDFDQADLPVFKPYRIVGVPDGYTWNLGDGYEIELVHLGGHTAGHAAYLDKTGRNLFCGDDFLSMRVGITGPRPTLPYGEYATISAFRNNVFRLNKRIGEIDHLFPGHHVTDIESAVIPSMLSTLDIILSDPLHNYDFCGENKKGLVFQKYVPGLGTIAYTEHSIGNMEPLYD